MLDKDDITVVLFYNKKILIKILNDKENMKFLSNYGYGKHMKIGECLEYLSQRYRKECPHEIGIFLGYPLKDMEIFTKYRKKECLMVGYWKVYLDVKTAKKTFRSYDLIKYKVLKSLSSGINPIQLFGAT